MADKPFVDQRDEYEWSTRRPGRPGWWFFWEPLPLVASERGSFAHSNISLPVSGIVEVIESESGWEVELSTGERTETKTRCHLDCCGMITPQMTRGNPVLWKRVPDDFFGLNVRPPNA